MWLTFPAMINPLPTNLTGDIIKEKEDYAKVIELSLLFYEAQRSGHLTKDNRIHWRGDSAINDRGHNGEDLTGGYYDG